MLANEEIRKLRENYTAGALNEQTVGKDPLLFFQHWLKEAIEADVPEPNAMTIATLNNGTLRTRVVLLKEVINDKFVFYTNLDSVKSTNLKENGIIAINFCWLELQRQVNIEGKAVLVNPALNESYFSTRPRESQIGAWASSQSSVIESRTALEEKFKQYEKEFSGKEIPCPPNWGGWEVQPTRIEFWQGRPGRLHDRIQFTSEGNKWSICRLQP